MTSNVRSLIGRRLEPLCTLVALLVLVPASAASAAAWLPPEGITPAGGLAPVNQSVQVDAAGNAVAAFRVKGSTKPTPFAVQVSDRPVGGHWSAPVELAIGTTASAPSLSVDDQGDAVVVWADSSTAPPCTAQCLHVYRKPAGQSSWSLVENLPGATAFQLARVALDPSGSGDYVVMWADGAAGAGVFVRSRVYNLGTGFAGAPAVFNGGSGAGANTPEDIALAADSQGVFSAIFETIAATGSTHTVRRTFLTGRSLWTTASVYTAPGTTQAQQLGLVRNGQGGLTGAWLEGTQIVKSIARPVGVNSWSGITTVASVGGADSINLPRVTADPAGNGLAVWQHNGTGAAWIESAGAPGGGAWGAPQLLTPASGLAENPALALDSAGNALTVWDAFDAAQTGSLIESQSRPAGGSFGSQLGVTSLGSDNTPEVGVDAAGHVTTLWRTSGGFRSAVYDPVPPALPPASFPSAALTGGAAAFAATATDAWGPVTLTWDFGDGQAGTGESVSHSYAAAGDYNARVTARDGAGNETSRTATVSVSDPAATSSLTRPVAGKTANAEPVEPGVLIKSPTGRAFVPLTEPSQVVVGSIIDARNGAVRITIDDGVGGLDSAEFYGGVFQFLQPNVKPGKVAYAVIVLRGGDFTGCPRAPKAILSRALATASKGKSKTRSVRHLWADGKGAFRTVGRFSSATIRGTKWLTDDRCNGTRTRVANGKVAVRDFVSRRVRLLPAPKSYFARPKPRTKR